MTLLFSGEKIEDLQRNGLRIIQRQDLPKFGLEGVLLANFPEVQNGWRVADLCSGTGIVPLLLTSRAKGLNITGVEVNRELSEMAERSVELNGLQDVIEIINEDIRQWKAGQKHCDLVTVNPPYFRAAQGDVSPSRNRAMARTQLTGGLADVLEAGSMLLKAGGRLALSYRVTGLGEALQILDKLQLGVSRLRFVHHDQHSKASSFILESHKGCKRELSVEPPLIIYQKPGELTPEMLGVYFQGKPLGKRVSQH